MWGGLFRVLRDKSRGSPSELMVVLVKYLRAFVQRRPESRSRHECRCAILEYVVGADDMRVEGGFEYHSVFGK